jgi:hypothetical protein
VVSETNNEGPIPSPEALYNNTMNESIFYILYSPYHKAVKIGISDISGKRFAAHRQRGWLLVAYWHFFEGDKARAIESLVLQTLKKKHKPFLHKEDMPQGGYTETFDASKINKKGLIRMVNKAIRLVNDEYSHKANKD